MKNQSNVQRNPVSTGTPYAPPQQNVQPPPVIPQAQPLMPPVPQPPAQPVMQMPPPQAAMPQQPQAPMFPVYSSSSSYVPTPQPTVPPAQPQPNMGYTQQPAAATATPQSDSTKFSIPLEYRNSIMTSLPFICAQTKCLIHVEEPQQGSDSCVITITGQQDGIHVATSLLQSSVRKYHNV